MVFRGVGSDRVMVVCGVFEHEGGCFMPCGCW